MFSVCAESYCLWKILSVGLLSLDSLSDVIIGPYSFKNTQKFELDGLLMLVNLTIGSYSFNGIFNKYSSCRIVNCSELTSLCFGDSIFLGYKELEIRNCSKLISISMGDIDRYSGSFYSSTVLIEGNLNLMVRDRSSFSPINEYWWKYVSLFKSSDISKYGYLCDIE